ncbi:MAG: sigma-E factor negative regulatory protein, partial [Halioglobus sp.]|nr:sigma-E factor negative regulatory protein [Halioglobus sp.]
MSERMRESLSALMDDEANELELERVLTQIGDSGDLRHSWHRYNVARAALSGHQLAHLDRDISAQVRQALADEAGRPQSLADASVKQRLLRPVASLAVAASVA